MSDLISLNIKGTCYFVLDKIRQPEHNVFEPARGQVSGQRRSLAWGGGKYMQQDSGYAPISHHSHTVIRTTASPGWWQEHAIIKLQLEQNRGYAHVSHHSHADIKTAA